MARAWHICTQPAYKLGVWYFEDHSYCGPIRLNKQGEPTAENFGERHPFWPRYGRWVAQGRKVDAHGRCILSFTDAARAGGSDHA